MSSAAKLRRFGKGTAAVAVAATAMTAFGPAAMGAWVAGPGGDIGVVDTTKTGAAGVDNQGATLLTPGATGAQAMGDIVLSFPNSFKSGDYIDLAMWDRAAADGGTDGDINASAAKKLVFDSAPTVTVDNTPYAAVTTVTQDTDVAAANAEYLNGTPTAFTDATPANVPTQAPVFGVSLENSSKTAGTSLGKDKIRLKIDGVQSNGLATAVWRVRISGLKVQVGAEVTPGAIRVVPFAYDGQASGDATASALFGNVEDGPTAGFDPTIALYTVPAYVSPVSITAENQDLMGDGTAQSVGAVTIKETNRQSIQAGSYTLTIAGAPLSADSAPKVAFTTGSGQSITNVASASTATGATITFDVTTADGAAANAAPSSTISVTGLSLTPPANSTGAITYTLTGGSVASATTATGGPAYLTRAGLSTAITDATAPAIPAETAFSAGISQADINRPDVPQGRGTISAGANAVGGNNRYETARKIAKLHSGNGDYAIIASGQNFPDALSSGYLSQRALAPIVLTQNNYIPSDTLESLRERNVKKVFLIGGTQAVSSAVEKQLASTPSYYYDAAAQADKPRGSNLEVIRLGGASRYSTNQLVNMYAAAQFTSQSTVGKTAVEYGKALRTTAMLARGDGFPDALTANLLTAGRSGGLSGTAGTTATSVQNSPSSPGGFVITGGIGNLTQTGNYSISLESPGVAARYVLRGPDGQAVASTADFDSTAGAPATNTFVNQGASGTTPLTTPIVLNNPLQPGVAIAGTQTIGITYTAGSSATTGDPVLSAANALPVILTEKGSLSSSAEAEFKNLYIEHVLVVGGADVIPDSVVKSVDGMNITTRRLAGKDRYETAKAVNEYALNKAAITAAGETGGLGFVDDNAGSARLTAFLANGLNYPDALVAGPWASRTRDAMVLVLTNSIPEPTKAFLTEKADVIDNATALGLAAAVMPTVTVEANKLVAAK